MKPVTMASVLAVLMVATSVAGVAARPSAKASDSGPSIVLEAAVPKQFGAWQELEQASAQVVNPQTQEILDKIYSQILTRTYVRSDGARIMLSLAYGDDQRGALQAHMPEVCYPAQGFKLLGTSEQQLQTSFGELPVKRLSTALGARSEPVTYWFTVGGEKAVKSKLEQRLIQLKLGLTGQIPDGLLFRVSSIDGNPSHAYAVQDEFIKDLLSAVSVKDRTRLSGLSGA